jgi:uncharacterized protein YutE (UPF0331/DUF86 family)
MTAIMPAGGGRGRARSGAYRATDLQLAPSSHMKLGGPGLIMNDQMHGRDVANLLHYAGHVLVDLFPLSSRTYKDRSLDRRASYSYLNEIVEAGHRVLATALRANGFQIGDSYRERVELASTHGLLPATLARDLLMLKTLRNRATHENPVVNEGSEVHTALLALAAVGFAMFQLSYGSGHAATINKEYMLHYLAPPKSDRHRTEETDPDDEIGRRVWRRLQRQYRRAFQVLSETRDVPTHDISTACAQLWERTGA